MKKFTIKELEQMNTLSNDDRKLLLDQLGEDKDFSDDFIEKFDDEDNYFENVCGECSSLTEEKGHISESLGVEGWTVCPDCRTTEGKTLEIQAYPKFGIQVIFETKDKVSWGLLDDNLKSYCS